jgi:hypothetical protein
MAKTEYHDDIDYDDIVKLISAKIGFLYESNSAPIMLEMYYTRKEGNNQTHTIPTHPNNIKLMLEKLSKRRLIDETQLLQLQQELKSIDSKVSGTHRLRST